MKDKIFKLIKNTFTLTGLTLVVVTLSYSVRGATWLYMPTVYECLLANAIIQAGLSVISKFDSKYAIIETLLNITLVLAVLIVCGYVFSWYSGMPLWLLILIGIGVYCIGSFLDAIRINDDIAFINRELQKRNKENHGQSCPKER